MKIKILFLCVMILSLSFSAHAQIFDNAGLLSSEQQAYVEERIASVAAVYNFNLVIITERNAGGLSIEAFADLFSTQVRGDGCLLLQLTEIRDYDITVYDRGDDILNDSAFNKLENDTLKHLKNDNYFEAYLAFIRNWEIFLALEAQGRNYNFFYQWNLVLVIVSWVLAIVIGVYVVTLWKSKMNTALAQTQANAYTVPGSLTFKEKNDRFLYSTVTKTKRVQSSSISSSGSSSRSSSSGSRRSSSRSGRY